MSDLAEAIFPQRTRDRVVHCRRDDFDTLVDRSTAWGNPKRLGDYDGRLGCFEAYLTWLQARPTSKYDPQFSRQYDQVRVIENIHLLEDRTLGCWCAPLLCHGHVLAAMAAADDPREAISWIFRRIEKVRRDQAGDGHHPDPYAQSDPDTLKNHPGNKY